MSQTRTSLLWKSSRRLAGGIKRALLPKAEVAAWRKASRLAERVPRFTKGRIHMCEYDLEYVDLLTLCPQWEGIFVRESLSVALQSHRPRILDCGANVGLASMYFKRRYPNARISAFEADPAIASVLRANLARNGLDDVEVHQAAIWTSDGVVDFRCEGADSGAVSEEAGASSPGLRAVPGVRLKRLLESEPVDVLKLDIEGSEHEVLSDCGELLSRVRVLLLDLHEFTPSRRSTARVLDLLDASGFVWSLDELCPLPWREPVADGESPFPGSHLCWAVLVRAWRSEPAAADC